MGDCCEGAIGGIFNGGAAAISGGLADLEHDISGGLADLNHDVNAALANLDSSLGLSTTVTNLVKNPLPTIATLALTAVGVPAPISSALVTMANGGSFEQGIISMATSYIGDYVGESAGKAFEGSQFAAGIKNIDPALASVIKTAVTSASGAAAVTALKGGNFSDILASAANGAVTSYVTQKLSAEMGFTDPKKLDTKLVNSAISSATNAILKGQDIGKAITSSVVQTALTESIRTGVDTIVSNNTTLKGLQTSISSAVADAKDYFTNTVSKAYDSLTTASKAVNNAATNYNYELKYLGKKDAIEAIYKDSYDRAMSYPPGQIRDLSIEGANTILTNFADRVARIPNFKASYDTALTNYNARLNTYTEAQTNYDSRIQTVNRYNTQIEELNTAQNALVTKVSEDVATFEGEAAKNANLLATQIGEKAVAASSNTIASTVGINADVLEAKKPETNKQIEDWFNRSSVVKKSWSQMPTLKPGEDMTTLIASAPKAVTDALNKDLIKNSSDFSTAYAMARVAYGGGKTFEWTNPDTGKTSSFSTNTKQEVALQPFDATAMSRSGLGGAAQAALDAGKTSFTWVDGTIYKVPDAFSFLKGPDQSSAENKRLLEAGVVPVKSNGQTFIDQLIATSKAGLGEQLQAYGNAIALATGSSFNNVMVNMGAVMEQQGKNQDVATIKAQETKFDAAMAAASDPNTSWFDSMKIVGKAGLDNPVAMLSYAGREIVQEGLPKLAGTAVGLAIVGTGVVLGTPVAATAAIATIAGLGVTAVMDGFESFGSNGAEAYNALRKAGVPEAQAREKALWTGAIAASLVVPAEFIANKALFKHYIDGVTQSGIKGYIAKYGSTVATQALSEGLESYGESAIVQFNTTGKINTNAALASGMFGAMVAVGTSGGILAPSGIKDATVIGKDIYGKSITFGETLSGAKTLDINTINSNATIGKSIGGTDITLGSLTAMGLDAGLDIGMLSQVLPSSLVNRSTVVGVDADGTKHTLGELSGVTQDGSDTGINTKNIFDDAHYVTQAEVKEAYADAGITDPTPEQLAKYVGKKDETATLKLVETNAEVITSLRDAGVPKGKIASIADQVTETIASGKNAIDVAHDLLNIFDSNGVDPKKANTMAADYSGLMTTEQINKTITDALAKNPSATAADIQAAVNTATKDFATLAEVKAAIKDIKFPAGLTAADVTQSIKTYMDAHPGLSLADVSSKITDATKGLATTTGVQTTITNALKGYATTSDIQAAIKDIKFPAGLTAADVTKSIKTYMDAHPGLSSKEVATEIATYMKANPPATAADVKTAVDNATKNMATKTDVTDLKSALSGKIDAAIKAGATGDAALQKGIDALATQLKTSKESLLKTLGTTETNLKADFAVKISKLETTFSLAIEDAIAAGAEGDAALNTAINKVATSLGTTKDALLKQLGTTEAALSKQFNTKISGLDTKLSTAIAEVKAAGLAGDKALQAAISKVAADQKTDTASLLKQMGTTEANLKTSFTTQLSTLEDKLSDEIDAAVKAGASGDAALQKGIDSLATKMGVNQTALLTEIGKSADTLKTQFSTQLATVSQDLQTKFDALTKEQQTLATQLTNQGVDLNTAITQAQQQTQQQITGISQDLQTKFDTLSKADQNLATQLTNQGVDLNTAIDTVKQQSTTQYNNLTNILATNQAATQKQIADEAAAAKARSDAEAAAAKARSDAEAAAAKARSDALAKAGAAQALKTQRTSNLNNLVNMLGQAGDTGGQQVTTKQVDPAKIAYVYDWNSIFANPSQQNMFVSPYAKGGMVNGLNEVNDELLNILKG
jgi:hypothetical protein